MSAEMGVFLSYQEHLTANSFNWYTNRTHESNVIQRISKVCVSIVFQFPIATDSILAVCVKNSWFFLQFRNRVNQIYWRNGPSWDAELIVAAVLIHCLPQFYAILRWELNWLLSQKSSLQISMRSPAWWSSAIGIVHSPPGTRTTAPKTRYQHP